MTALFISRFKQKKIDRLYLAADSRVTVEDQLICDNRSKIVRHTLENGTRYFMYCGELGSVDYAMHTINLAQDRAQLYELLVRDKENIDLNHAYTIYVIDDVPGGPYITQIDKDKGYVGVTSLFLNELVGNPEVNGSGGAHVKVAYDTLEYQFFSVEENLRDFLKLPRRKQIYLYENIIQASFNAAAKTILSINSNIDIISIDIK